MASQAQGSRPDETTPEANPGQSAIFSPHPLYQEILDSHTDDPQMASAALQIFLDLAEAKSYFRVDICSVREPRVVYLVAKEYQDADAERRMRAGVAWGG